MRHRTGNEFQLVQVGPHHDTAEAGRRRVHPQQRAEDLDIRAGAPRVAVGTRRVVRQVDGFGKSRQPARQHVPPVAQLIQVALALAHFDQRQVHVELEKQRSLRQSRRGQGAQHQVARRRARNHIAQDSHGIGVLRELLFGRRIGVQAPAGIPVEPLRRFAKLFLPRLINLGERAQTLRGFQLRCPAIRLQQ